VGNFVSSGKGNPCPICSRTKDDKCRIGDEGRLILCGTEVNSRKPKDTLGDFLYLGESENGVWGKWVPISDEWEKTRPESVEFRYSFFDKNGNKVVDEVRVYDAQGRKKSWMDPTGSNTAILLPYRYPEAIAALENGAAFCLILEGPPKVDIAFALGLPAVAFANGFKSSRDSHWFEGYESRVVLVPDQDTIGLEKVAKMAIAYPMAQQWRPWPDSAWWQPEWIFKNGGKDFKDWVEQLRQSGHKNREISAMIMPNGNGPVDAGEFGNLMGAGEVNKIELKEESRSIRSRHTIPLPNNQYHEALELILKGLSSEPRYLESIYVQGNDFSEKWLVRVLVNPDKSVRIIDSLTVDKMHVELEKRFEFNKLDKKGGAIPSTCPDRIAKSLLSEGQWLPLKPLDRISRIPLLQWNGSINDVSGYYLEEKTILDVKKDEFKFKSEPTVDDAKVAAKRLKHFFREFHFKDLLGIQDKVNAPSVDRSGAIAALLTAVSRHMYDFAPCFITNAHTPGSGKGTLASVITIIQDGKVQSERTWNPDPVELDKVIVSELLNQPPSLVIGNIDSKFGGSIIESLMTKAQYPGRVLGLSKMVYPSTKTLLMANGNNLTISKDMVRRSIMTRLDCGVEKPQNIEYEVKDIIGHTRLHRNQLFVHVLTILQAFLLSGEVDTARSKLNGFEDWDKLVRGALLWIGEADPVQSQIALEEDDEDAVLLSRFIEAFLSDYYAGKAVTPKQMILKAESKDLMDKGSEDYCETLKEICYIQKTDSFSKESLGKFLAKNQGQVKAGYCIKKLKRLEGGQPWTVEAPIQPNDRIEV
jgi:hypothetical protein